MTPLPMTPNVLAIQEAAERLIEEAVAAAAQGKLARGHLDAVTKAVKDAAAAGSGARWIAQAHRRLGALLDAREKARQDAAVEADPSGRRRAARIAEPPLTVAFEDGEVCQTIDWSAFGVLVGGHRGHLAVGDSVSLTLSCVVVDGGGVVPGRVVWRSPSGAVAIEFGMPSVAVQIIKVRLLRAGLLTKASFAGSPSGPPTYPLALNDKG